MGNPRLDKPADFRIKSYVRLSPDLDARLRGLAFRRNVSKSQAIAQAIEQWVCAVEREASDDVHSQA